MSNGKQVIGYFRVATKEQLMSETEKRNLREWTKICQTYCNKVGAELLFVNQGDFGCEMPNGELRHIYADELAVILTNEAANLDGSEMTGPTMSM